jgi:hypothetical protein
MDDLVGEPLEGDVDTHLTPSLKRPGSSEALDRESPCGYQLWFFPHIGGYFLFIFFQSTPFSSLFPRPENRRGFFPVDSPSLVVPAKVKASFIPEIPKDLVLRVKNLNAPS